MFFIGRKFKRWVAIYQHPEQRGSATQGIKLYHFGKGPGVMSFDVVNAATAY